MAEAVIPVKHLEDITECAICHDTFTDPRTLPCIHTFCLKCITEWYKDKRPQDCVNCPFCRSELRIPDKGVNDFPKNTFIGKLLTIRELSVGNVEPKSCDWCKSAKKNPCETAKVYCSDCQVQLCETCEGFHSSIPVTRQHRTINSVDSTNGIHAKCIPTKCDKHPDKDLEIYCFNCADTVCYMCFLFQHEGHKPSDVKEVVDEFHTAYNKNISKLFDGLGKLDKSLAALESRRCQIVEQASKVEDEIRTNAEQMKTMIDCHKEKLLSDLNQLKVEKTKVVDNDIIEVKQNKAMTESLIKYSQELLQKGSSSDITRESKSINKRAEEMAKICEAVFEFDTSEQIISFTASDRADVINDAINKFFGKVVDSETRCQSRIFSPTLTHSVSVDKGVAAIATFGNRLFLAKGYECNNVEVYDTSTLQQLRQISIPSNESWGLATCSTSNCLYVSDSTNSKIHRVSLSTYSISTSWSVAAKPRGLSINRSHNLLVACHEPKKIQEYSTAGSLVREISDSNFLWQAIELTDGTLAVIRTGPECGVCVMSVDGKVLRSYGSSTAGSKPGQLSNPRSLAVDNEGFIIVADLTNNRNVVLNPTLTDARVLSLPISPGFNAPFGLRYDESRGQLFVGEWIGKRLLVFDGVFNLSTILS